MKMKTQIVATAVALTVVTAGVLYPMKGRISELEESVTSLEAEAQPSMDITADIESLRLRIGTLTTALEARAVTLSQDTLEARNEIESALQEELEKAGLRRISRERHPASQISGVPCFFVELVVEGSGEQLHGFLKGLESLPWATRVMELDIKDGDEKRRVQMKIAVLLESES